MNLKDKLQLFQRLRNDQHAVMDLQLLKDKNPSHGKLARFSRDPKRYAHDILYVLLDVATEEEIIQNRQLEDGSSDTLTGAEEEKSGDGSSDTLTGAEEEKSEDGSSDTLTGAEEENSKKK